MTIASTLVFVGAGNSISAVTDVTGIWESTGTVITSSVAIAIVCVVGTYIIVIAIDAITAVTYSL